jgi:hypothetical protein
MLAWRAKEGGVAFCSNCGTEMSEQAPACPKCGHPTQALRASGPRTEGTAIIALVLGILGIISCPLVLSIPAVIVGNQAKAKMAQDPTLEGEGMARAGVILGWIGIGLGALMIAGGIIALVLGVTFSGTDVGPVLRDAMGVSG